MSGRFSKMALATVLPRRRNRF